MAGNSTANGIGFLGSAAKLPSNASSNYRKGSTIQTAADDGKTKDPIIQKVEVTLAGKPAKMSAGEYLTRQALAQIAPAYGLNSADIDLEIQYIAEKKGGRFIDNLNFGENKIAKPNNLTDDDVNALVARGNTKIDFGIHQSSVQRMLERDEIVKWLAGRDALGIAVTEQDKRDLAQLGYSPEDVGRLRDAKYMQYQGYREKALADVNDVAKQKLIADRVEYLTAHPEEVVKENDNISSSKIDFLIRATATREIGEALTNSKMTALEYTADKKNYEQSLTELRAWEQRTAQIPTSTYLTEGGKNLVNSLYWGIGEAIKGVSVAAVNNSIHVDQDGKVIQPQVSDSLGYKIGDWIQQNVQFQNVNKDTERTFTGGVLPKTVGGLLPAVFGAWATESLTAFVSIYDGLRTGGSIYDEAKRSGATEAQAQNAALLTGGFVGLTDKFGYGKTLETLNTSAGAKTWQTIFTEAVKDGGRNSLVAGAQTVFENGVAKNIYDNNRGYLDNVRERMIAAGITGATLKGGLEIVAKVHTGANPHTLAETQQIFRIEKSPLELNAKQIEYRNSGIDLRTRLNEKFDAENKIKKVDTPKVEVQSDEKLRVEFRQDLYEYNQHAREIEKLKLKYPEIKNIPTEDLVAVRAYTSEDYYEGLNTPLRTKDTASLQRKESHIICATSGLNQLPDYKGIVFRGRDLTTIEAEGYKAGKIVTEQAFTSTSYTKNAAFKKNTEFVIYSETGKKIDFLSLHPSEKEVLFKLGTKFEVLEVIYDDKSKTRIIQMKEVVQGENK